MSTFFRILLLLLFTETEVMAQIPGENPTLPYWFPEDQTIKTPTEKGKYVNEEFPFQPSYKDFRRWKNEVNPYAEEKKNANWTVPLSHQPQNLFAKEDYCVWMGHCTFLFQIDGIRFITDPVFGSATPFYPRKSQLPFAVNDLPKIDFILLSHDHRDHLDFDSLRQLKKKNPEIKVYSGLKMDGLLKKVFKKNRILCAGWNQVFMEAPFKIIFVPARHWSKRGLFDFNDRLWGGFIIQTKDKNIYFSGDTGYGSHFRRFGERMTIDYALIGIGAYQPEWFMESNHISPTHAIKAFDEMNAKHMIPMHYGCFDLSNESMQDPIRVYRNIKELHPKKNRLLIPQLGENIFLTQP